MTGSSLSRRSLLGASAAAMGGLVTTSTAPSASAALPPVWFGAYTAGMDATPSRLDQLSRTLGQSLIVASVFRGKGDVWPGPVESALTSSGRALLVSWHLDYRSYGYWASTSARSEIAAVARRVRDFRRPVYIRPWAEMNGDWQPFQPTAAPTDGYPTGYAAFIAAWRNLVNVFRAAGATNVRWVFNPTTDVYPGTTDIRRIWPGASYVTVVALDGYNWGTGGIFRWRSFRDIYAAQYSRITQLAPSHPLWICEIGSADPLSAYDPSTAPSGSTKGRWWLDMAGAARTWPALRGVVLFDVRKERDWRAASSSEALRGLTGALSTLRNR